MPPFVQRSPAQGITEGFGITVWRFTEVAPECGSAMPVDFGIWRGRCHIKNPLHVGSQIGQFVRIYNLFENVEAGLPVGFKDIGVQIAVCVMANGAAVAEAICTFFTSTNIVCQLGRMDFG